VKSFKTASLFWIDRITELEGVEAYNELRVLLFITGNIVSFMPLLMLTSISQQLVLWLSMHIARIQMNLTYAFSRSSITLSTKTDSVPMWNSSWKRLGRNIGRIARCWEMSS